MNDVISKAMKDAAENAGKVIMSAFRNSFSRLFKDKTYSYKSLVTEVDLKSQEIIRQTLIQELADSGISKNTIGFIGEENLDTKGEHLFVIDPIDGTVNFSFGIPYFCVSIGYVYKGDVVLGLILNPNDNSFYIGELGKGAYKFSNGKKTALLVKEREIKDSILAWHYNYDLPTLKKQFKICEKLIPQVAATRTNGSIALDLCLFAENRYNIVINGRCFIWDLAAVLLILKEAKGSLTDWEGRSIELFTDNPKFMYKILASSPNAKKMIVKKIALGN